MNEPAEDTGRTIPSQTVIAFGVPVTLELNRGALEIHLGNVDPYAEGEHVIIRPSGYALVRVTAAGEDGSAGMNSVHHLYPKRQSAAELAASFYYSGAPGAAGLPAERKRDYWDPEGLPEHEIVTADRKPEEL